MLNQLSFHTLTLAAVLLASLPANAGVINTRPGAEAAATPGSSAASPLTAPTPTTAAAPYELKRSLRRRRIATPVIDSPPIIRVPPTITTISKLHGITIIPPRPLETVSIGFAPPVPGGGKGSGGDACMAGACYRTKTKATAFSVGGPGNDAGVAKRTPEPQPAILGGICKDCYILKHGVTTWYLAAGVSHGAKRSAAPEPLPPRPGPGDHTGGGVVGGDKPVGAIPKPVLPPIHLPTLLPSPIILPIPPFKGCDTCETKHDASTWYIVAPGPDINKRTPIAAPTPAPTPLARRQRGLSAGDRNPGGLNLPAASMRPPNGEHTKITAVTWKTVGIPTGYPGGGAVIGYHGLSLANGIDTITKTKATIYFARRAEPTDGPKPTGK